MCFSATASFSAAAVLVGAGIYALYQARNLTPAWWKLWAVVPVAFGVQQGFEGLVWQALDTGEPERAVPFAIGFHFFSHFLWLWLFPLASYLLEPGPVRKRIFGGCAVFGAFAGSLVLSAVVLHPEWMTVGIKGHSIIYKFHVPYKSPIHLPIRPALLYGLTILVPLLCSSHGQIRVFGCLATAASVLASQVYQYAFVSVWCFFTAVLSLYIVYMVRSRQLQAPSAIAPAT